MRLGNLFNAKAFVSDLGTYTTIGVGLVGGIAAYNWAFKNLASALKFNSNETAMKWGRPLGAIVLGIMGGAALGQMASKQRPGMGQDVLRNLGSGVAVGLVTAGALNLANVVAPDMMAKLPISGGMTLQGLGRYRALRGMRGMRGLRGAPIQIEQVRGAPVSVQLAGLGRGAAATLY